MLSIVGFNELLDCYHTQAGFNNSPACVAFLRDQAGHASTRFAGHLAAWPLTRLILFLSARRNDPYIFMSSSFTRLE